MKKLQTGSIILLTAMTLLACGIGIGGADPTPTVRLAFATFTPTPFPKVTVSPMAPTPAPTATPLPPEDISAYQSAMRPAFVDDVNRLMDENISRYQIVATVSPNPDTGSVTVNGRLNVSYTNSEVVYLNQVYFRLLPNTPSYGGAMEILAATVNGVQATTQLLADNTTLEVTLPSTLKPFESVEISLQFSTSTPQSTRFGYGLLGAENGVIALANFFPILTVFDDAGWHVEVLPLYGDATYTDISLFDATLTIPADMTLVATGETVSDTPLDDGTRQVRVVTGPVRDFFAAMSANFAQAETQVDDITVTSFYLTGNDAGGQWMLDVSSRALTLFNRLFGEYPYHSFKIVSVPLPAELGGMEFPGVIAMAERYYQQPGQLQEFVTAHEVSHQWWYGLVGNDQANEPWLDEALAQYSAVLYFEQTYGKGTHQDLIDANFNFPYNQLVANGLDRPASEPVNQLSEEEYMMLVYGKAPLFFDEIREHIGDPSFFAGLHDYGEVYRYGIAKPTDPLARFEQTSGQDLDEIYRKWIGEIPDKK